jgi:Xaa-Pro aminopeptidase
MRYVRKAVAITLDVFRELESPFGKTERQVSIEIKRIIRKHGGTPAFPPIVASGSSSVVIHHRPGKKVIRRNRPLILDLGARYKGYSADVTRMYIPDERAERVYGTIRKMQQGAIKKLKIGADFREIHKSWAGQMKRKRWKVKHGIGHGVGRHIHERIERIEPGMVLTIEPGVYIKRYAGFRIEDTILVKGKKIEVLSGSVGAELTF